MNYSIIDVETTGTSPVNGRITEVAIYIFNGFEIIDSFCTLINPECKIPWNITKLTGITNEMVENQPRFFEVAKKIVEITAGTIFVAHNASFDYSFIREEFKRLGYDFKRKTLCTVNLSRKLIPGLTSYSLGNLCHDLGIAIEDRHRASGDAKATVQLFKKILHQNQTLDNDLFSKRNGLLSEEKIAQLPGKTGVYYLFNEQGDLIYIGKSKNIHQRIIAHLNNRLTKKAMEMSCTISEVDFEVTGSELVAQLLESEEIKKNRPKYNRALRRSSNNFGIYLFEDENGFLNLKVAKVDDVAIPLKTYDFLQEATDALHYFAESNTLCKKFCNLNSPQKVCFSSQLDGCSGACQGKEMPEEHNERVRKAIKIWGFHSDNFFVLDHGREKGELAVVKVEYGRYVGYGFLQSETISNDFEIVHDCIRPKNDNWDARQIIKRYLKINHRLIRIMEY